MGETFDDLFKRFFENIGKETNKEEMIKIIMFEPIEQKELSNEEIDKLIEKAVIEENYEKAAELRDLKEKPGPKRRKKQKK